MGLPLNAIGSRHALGRVSGGDETSFRDFHSQRFLAGIDKSIFFQQYRKIGRREKRAAKFPASIVAVVEIAFHCQSFFEGYLFDFFIRQRASVDRHRVKRVPIETAHDASAGIVGNRAEHRPHHTLVDMESPVAIHAITENSGNFFACHLDMVGMLVAGGNGPGDSSAVVSMPILTGFSRISV